METARMSSRGQIVIPKRLREQLGAQEDTTFAMDVVGGGIYLKPLTKKDFAQWLAKARKETGWLSDEEVLTEVKASRKNRS